MNTNISINNKDIPDYLQNTIEFLFHDVPDYVQRAYIKVRDTNRVNMLDSNGVLNIMKEHGDFEAILWLADCEKSEKYIKVDRNKYAKLLKVISLSLKNEYSINEEIYEIETDENLKEKIIETIKLNTEIISLKHPEPIRAIEKLFNSKSIKIISNNIIQMNESNFKVDYSGMPVIEQILRINPFQIDIKVRAVHSNIWNFEFELQDR